MTMDVAQVRDLMTGNPTTLSPDDALVVASDLMRVGRLRHLPVTDKEGKVVGLVSDRDLAGGALLLAAGMDGTMERRALQRVTTGEVMAKHVVATTPEAPLSEAARLMNKQRISCLPVLEDDSLVGVLTEHDFVTALVGPDAEVDEPQADTDEGVWDWSRFEQEVERLRTIRDEIRVQLRLASMEAKDGFEEAEQRWSGLERRLKGLRGSSEESLDDAVRIGRNFVKQIQMAYEELREKLGS